MTPVNVPAVDLFDATGPNLSKIGTDAQLLTAGYAKTRQWAQRFMAHPQSINGILYRSRHDPVCLDVALFQRAGLLPARLDPTLDPAGMKGWKRQPADGRRLVYGPAVLLKTHPALTQVLLDLEVAVLP